MRADEAVAVLVGHHTDELVVTGIGSSTAEWHRALGPEGDQSFHNHAMGLSIDIAIGLALAQRERRVWVLDGDGSVTMSFGVLLTLAMARPANLTCFVMSNRLYGTFGEPIVNAGNIDYVASARAAGVEDAHGFDDLEALESELPAVLAGSGPTFVVLEVEPSGLRAPAVPYEAAEIKYRFARHVEAVTGTPVLGPYGY